MIKLLDILSEAKLTISGTDKAIKMLKSELRNNNVDFEIEGNKVIVNDSPKAKMAMKMVKERVGMQSIKLAEKLDKVGQEDEDINNDGKVNKTDRYLDNRRKAIAKNIKEGDDHEVSMAQASLKSIISSATQLMGKIGNMERDIPGWIQDHITNAENYIDQAAQGFHELNDNE